MSSIQIVQQLCVVLNHYLRKNDARLQDDVLSEVSRFNINKAVIKLDNYLNNALRVAKKKKTFTLNEIPKKTMERANTEFENFQKTLKKIT